MNNIKHSGNGTTHGGPKWILKVWSIAATIIVCQLFSSIQAAPARAAKAAPAVTLRRTLTATGAVSAVAFSPDGKTVAGGISGKVILWDLQGQELHTLRGHSGQVTAILFSPDGKSVVTAGGAPDGTIKLWDAATGKETQTLAGHTGGVNTIAFSADGQTLASGGADKLVALWDAASGKALKTLAEHDFAVTATGYSQDNTTIVSVSGEMTKQGHRVAQIVSWNSADGDVSKRVLQEIEQPFAVSPNAGFVAATSNGRWETKLWNIKEGTFSPTPLSFNQHITVLSFSPDGRMLAAGAGKSVLLWNGTEIQPLSETGVAHTDKVLALCFSSDGSMIATASADKTVRIWKLS